MRIDICCAALGPDAERRVRLAASALAAFEIVASARAWDGTRCHVLVVDAADGYGRHAMEAAGRRSIPVIALGADTAGSGVRCLPSNVPMPTLVAALRELATHQRDGGSIHAGADGAQSIGGGSDRNGKPQTLQQRTSGNQASNQCGLLKLATDTRLRGQDLIAVSQGRTIHIVRSQGKVFAASLSDLLSTRNHLANEGWTFAVCDDEQKRSARGEVSSSLDVFLLYGALHAAARLPAIPRRRYGISDWPDLGSATDLFDALRIAKALQRCEAYPEEIAAICDVELTEVSACLWAFNAGELLSNRAEHAQPVAQPSGQPTSAFSGLLSRLATHFGLATR